MAEPLNDLSIDAPDAASTLRHHLGRVDERSRIRGTEYLRAGRVLAIEPSDRNTVSATVRGQLNYEVELIRHAGVWKNFCSCPLVRDCKHAYAAGLAWLEKLGEAPVVAEPKGRRGTFREQWEPKLAEQLGRPLAQSEGAFLGLLSQIFHNFRQVGALYPSELARLGFPTREAQRSAFTEVYESWWETPPRDPMELWQYIAYDIEASGLTVPPFMRPATDTSVVRRAVEGRLRREAVARWTDRFNSLAASGQRQGEIVPIAAPAAEPVELRVRLDHERVAVEFRTKPEGAWRPATRSFVQRLIGRSVRWIELAASPATLALLAICQEHYHRFGEIELTASNHTGRQLLHQVLSHPLARTAVVGPGCRPLTFAPEPLVWRVARSADNARDYVIALHRPDGQPLSPAAVHLPGPPDLYLIGGDVYRGPPPLDGSSAVAAIVPEEVLEDPEVLMTLRRFGSALPPEVEARFVAVPLRARIECRLVELGGVEKLALDLLAVADDPPTRRVWTPFGWRGEPEPVRRRAARGRLTLFDMAEAEAVAGCLAAGQLDYDSAAGCWTRRITRAFAEEFLEWRESLPAHVEVEATGELASLLGAPVRARVEFELIEAAGQRDWFDLALALRPEDTTLTRAEIALLLKARGKLVRLPGRGWRRLHVELDDVPVAALEEAGFHVDALTEAAAGGERHRLHALQLAQKELNELLPERQAEALRARARELVLPEALALPAGLRATLRPYQEEGFQFLAFLAANRLGGVLADDMGLGKTLQTLAWLLWLAERQPAEAPLRVLVVCPKSVVGNWEAETARFAPELRVVRFTPELAAQGLGEQGGRALIVVANYTQLRLQAKFFQAQRWHVAVLDEGQFIKNPGSKVAQTARELSAEHRLVLTGTPIENHLLDLWSLFAFALPGLLGAQAAFKRQYEQDNPLALRQLRARVRHFLLRRTKAQVAADLPARTEEDVLIELEGEQARLYQAELKRARAQLLRVETPKQLDKERFNILASLMRLRQICCHPGLIDATQREAPAAKLEALLERVEELRDEGHQVLVFSQFVQMLEIIQARLAAAGIEHLLLTGQTEDREALVARFQGDRSKTVFLLSLKAAGFGLNLTAASYVILFDPWWNPAVEAQAIDRTHRIGQSAPVNAYRFIARGTVEEKIRSLQREKAALAGAIMQEEALASVLDLETLKQVLA